MTGNTSTEKKTEYLADIFLIRFELLTSNLEKFITDGDAESLHQSRVSARKMEALFDTFGHLSFSGDYKKISSEIKELIKLLGAGRESDVCIQFTDDYLQVIKIHDARIMGFRRHLNRIAGYSKNRDAIQNAVEKIIKDNDRIKEFFNAVFRHENRMFRPENLRGYLKYSMPKLYDEIINYKDDVIKGSKRKLHKMRIKSKPLRYMLETSVEFLNLKVEKYHKPVKAFVEKAGTVHDYDVLIDILNGYRKEFSQKNSKVMLLGSGNSLKIFSSYLTRMRKSEFEHLKEMLEGFNEEFRKSFIDSLM
ncbi:MAG: CHAD domain-containing protein [Ignavibacteria bacterium]|nr:CHAD domain-containing protein [Ignavibacteria bacterium]